MYLDEYKRWLAADLEDADLKPELAKVEGNDDEIKDRFAVALKFGTAGLRGVLGAGTNRMNIYVVRQATQGLANWVLTQGGTQTVAISYDSRLKSDIFAKTAAGVLAANGIKVRIYDALMPVPALSFATRYYECNAGIMVTASHNPAKYNGYKAYGPDGCQMTDDAAAIVYDEIQKTDVLTGAKYISFAEGVENGMIRFVGDDCKKALYDAIEARQVRPGLCKTAGLKLVYSPLNGSGLVPVTHVLNDMGITDITIVPEQEYPNGYFTTCSYPNPEIFEALKLGLELATKTGADLMLATDPDADRHGIVCPNWGVMNPNHYIAVCVEYLFGGNRPGWPEGAAVGKTLVSSSLIDRVAASINAKVIEVPVGFKWFVDPLFSGEVAFGGEESSGMSFLRKDGRVWTTDKDGLIPDLLAAEITAKTGKNPAQLHQEQVERFGESWYKRVDTPTTLEQKAKFAKLTGDDVAATQLAGEDITAKLTEAPGNHAKIGGLKVTTKDNWFAARPSGTENIYKVYAESFVSPEALDKVLDEATVVVDKALSE